MNSIRLVPADGENPHPITAILNDEVVSGATVIGAPGRVTVHLEGPGSERLLVLTVGECRQAGIDEVTGRYHCLDLSWPLTWRLSQKWELDNPDAPLSLDEPYHWSGYSNCAELEIEANQWKGFWSIAEFVAAMQRVATNLEPPAEIEHPLDLAAFRNVILVRLPIVADETAVLGDLLDCCASYVPPLEAAAWAELSRTQDNSSVIQCFRFPRAVSAACKQYLAYFTQFLSDLGIEADAEIQSSAAEVLFRVTPRDGPEALERVREALDAYLALSTAIEPFATAEDTNLAVIQLQANVEHLRSQLRLARAETGLYRAQLDAREAQLEAKDLSIQVLRHGSGSIAPQSDQPGVEPLFGGLVTLGRLEKAGLGIDWGVLLRKLRRRFTR